MHTRALAIAVLAVLTWGACRPTPTPPTPPVTPPPVVVPPPVEPPVEPPPPVVAVPPALSIVGRDWQDRGVLYRPRWVSALSILTHTAEARDAYLDWAVQTGFTGVRVFAGALTWAGQTPDGARAALVGLIEATSSRGLALEVTAVTDSSTGYDWRVHLRAVRDLVAPHAHVVLEGANELGHSTQAPDVTAEAVAQVLQGFARPWAVGAPIGQDEPAPDGTWPAGQGTHSTVHLDRGRDRWEQVRRVREIYAVVEATGRPALNNEPIGAGDTYEPGRRFAEPAMFAVLGALDASFRGVGGVFHSTSGLAAERPSAAQQASADAYVAAHRAVSTTLGDAPGQYLNVGHAGSPVSVADFTRVVRLYSFTTGNRGVAVYVGAQPGSVGEVWQHGWTPRRDVYQIAGTDGRFLRVVEIGQ